jgi:hypothetical protein
MVDDPPPRHANAETAQTTSTTQRPRTGKRGEIDSVVLIKKKEKSSGDPQKAIGCEPFAFFMHRLIIYLQDRQDC